jgi:hypothetical protein
MATMLALRGRGVTLVAVLVATTSVTLAHAGPPDKDRCFDAYEEAQRLRKDHRLRAAHEQLLTCAADTCPSFVRQDCAKWLGEVETAMPTIVVLAKRDDGTTIDGAHATLDGAPFADALDGRAVPVDPGPHDLRCEVNGAVIDERIVVAEGIKNQPFFVTFDAGPAHAAPPVQRAETPAARPSRGGGAGLPTAAWVLGGVAVAGGISFAVFGVMGRHVQSCAPYCTQSQVNDLRRDYLVADVSWITGLVAAGAALYLALTAPSSAAAAPLTAIRW